MTVHPPTSLARCALAALTFALTFGCGPGEVEVGSLTGRICHGSGAPDTGAEVEVEAVDGERFNPSLDRNGAWEVDDVPAGNTIVHVSQRDGVRTILVEVEPSATAEALDPNCAVDGLPIMPGGNTSGNGDGNGDGDGDVDGTGGDGDDDGDSDGLDSGDEALPPSGNGAVSGCICDSKMGAWVDGGNVWVDLDDGTRVETLTDADGCFMLEGVPAGPCTVVASTSSAHLTFPIDIIADAQVAVQSPETCELPDACLVEAVITPETASSKSDIIVVVDSSGSMDEENDAVQDNLNAFSTSIGQSGIDQHVVLIGSTDEMNVPPPLGGSEHFMHLDIEVDSTSALVDVLEAYPLYQDFLRPDARQHIVIVSDDNSEIDADEFTEGMAALSGTGFAPDWVVHGVVAHGNTPGIGCHSGADEGDVYMDLIDQTGGVLSSICDDDFSDVFGLVSTAVENSVALPCSFTLPEVPDGFEHDLANIGVMYEAYTGLITEMDRVDAVDQCTGFEWYMVASEEGGLENVVTACPVACNVLRNSGDGLIHVDAQCLDGPPEGI